MLIPAYNAESFLPRLLSSAANQIEAFDEVWVYDDCSTDDTAAVAEGYGANVIRGDINQGCSHGKNVLASLTHCDWLHFHDADDDIGPDFVAIARSWMVSDGADVVLLPYTVVDNITDEIIGTRTFDRDQITTDSRSYALREQINPFCGLYRRTSYLLAGGYDEDPLVLYNEDVAFHVRLAFAGLKFDAGTNFSVINRKRVGSMSAGSQLRCVQSQYHVMRKASELPDVFPYRADIARKLFGIAGVAGALLDWKTANSAISLALRLDHNVAAEGGAIFSALCSVSPNLALRIREAVIRIAKPSLRGNGSNYAVLD